MRIAVAGSMVAVSLTVCLGLALPAHGQDVPSPEAVHRIQLFGQFLAPDGEIRQSAFSMEVPVDWELMSPEDVISLREQNAEQGGGGIDFGFHVGEARADGRAGFLVGDVQWMRQRVALSEIAESLGAETLSTLPDSDGWWAVRGPDGWVLEEPTGFLWTKETVTAPDGVKSELIKSYFARDGVTVGLQLQAPRLESDSWVGVRRIGETFRVDLDPRGDRGEASTAPTALMPGIWSLSLAELEWQARIEPGSGNAAPRIWILAEGGEGEAEDVSLEDGVLSLTVPVPDLRLRCTLSGQPDGTYAGRCMASDGRGAVMRLTPPPQP